MSPSIKKPLVLAGDVGGTKTLLALFQKGEKRPVLICTRVYSSKDAPDLESIIAEFLKRNPAPIKSACIGIAGPVINGRCRTTNLPWDVSENRIKDQFRLPAVRLINDLAVTAMAIPFLQNRERRALNSPRTDRKKDIALIAPGTGLGVAFLLQRDGRSVSLASEGGHADFSPSNESEIDLWCYMARRWGHVSIERLLSGPGLVNIYSWLKDSGKYRAPAYLSRMIREMDPAAAITRAAFERNNPLCRQALHMFVSILGGAAGNLALTSMATGGVFIGGGIPPKILPKLMDGTLMTSFMNKGRFRAFLEKIPVRVILNDRAALLGAAVTAFQG